MNLKSIATTALLAFSGLLAQTTPYNGTASELPGVIPAQNFDEGGSGVAYYINGEFSRNGNYTEFRPGETVSLENPANTVQIGWFHSGSWIKYSYDVKVWGTYDVYFTYRCGSFDEPRVISMDFGNPEITPVDFTYRFNDEGWSKIPEGERVLAIQDLALKPGPGVLTLQNTGNSDINIIGLEFEIKTVGIHPQARVNDRRVLAKPGHSGRFIRTTFPFRAGHNAVLRADVSGRLSTPGQAAR
jgi:hypothetical protein